VGCRVNFREILNNLANIFFLMDIDVNIFCIINELVQNAAENIETRPINHYIQTPEEQGNIKFE
jgi:hypothetical protein